FEKEPGKVYYLRVQVERLNGRYRARPTGPQGSGILTSLILADGIGVIPEDQSLVRRGDAITVQLITQPEDH
ncbi:MAG: molybdopterin molybdenumtransferase MoeA, partial [Terriglobia bacterium]